MPKFRDIFDVLEEKPKKKRKRRTKAEMAAAREKEAQLEAEKNFVVPQNTTVYSNRPIPTKSSRPIKKYPPPPPKPKFDLSKIEEEIVLPGGAKYGITKETKHGKHMIYYCSAAKDWSILYDARYNDVSKHWNFYNKLKVRLESEKNGSTKKSVASRNRTSKTKTSAKRKSTKGGVRKSRRNDSGDDVYNKSKYSAVA